MTTAPVAAPAANAGSNAVTRIDYLGPAPLIEGEDQDAYNRLVEQISATVKPADPLEDIWVRDVVDLTWEVMRYRRLSANLVSFDLWKGIYSVVLSVTSSPSEASNLCLRYERREPKALTELRAVLSGKGFDMGAVVAQSFAKKLDYMERIDRLVSNAERRRNTALMEVRLYRARLAEALRSAVKAAEDADYQVEYGEVASKSPNLGEPA